MDACRLYKDKKYLIRDASSVDIISKIVKLASEKLKSATSKVDADALKKIISSGKKLLTNVAGKLPSSWLLKEYMKAHYTLLKLNIGMTMKKFFMWTVAMLQKSYEKQRLKEKAEAVASAAADAAKAATEAAEKAAKKAAKWAETKAGQEAMRKISEIKKARSLDSADLINLYRDSLSVLSTLKQLKKALIARQFSDDRRRISRTKNPTMWEIRYVLGIKPGVQFYEKDWKAYKQNGFIVVENKRTNESYRKPQAEVVAAANAEKESKMNTVDPYLNSGEVQYGESEFSTPQKKRSLRELLKKLAATIAAVTAVVSEIKKLHSGSSGLGNVLRNFANGAVNWMRTAKETWQEVNRAV